MPLIWPRILLISDSEVTQRDTDTNATYAHRFAMVSIMTFLFSLCPRFIMAQ